MTDDDKYFIFLAMSYYGGSFVSKLGELWMSGDPVNKRRIENAWPEYMAEYGPETKFYRNAQKHYNMLTVPTT
jgi:hypothetical protein